MKLENSKIELAQQILASNNKDLINHLTAVFATQENDIWDEYSDDLKQSINKGIEQANNGELKSHTEVMKKYRKWQKK